MPTHTRFLVVGAGMTGLAFAHFIPSDDLILLESDSSIGGWCKTIQQDGFVWDWSGHFFHFRNPEIERLLVERMPPDEVVTVHKKSTIYTQGHTVDFPFQKNIHQLPQTDFIDCLHDLVFRPEGTPENFQDMLVHKFGHAIAQKFLIPYNTKLYACDLNTLDPDAMGRFFPHASLPDIVRNMKTPNNTSYNATFTYPRHGAIMYVNALAQSLRPGQLRLNQRLARVDLRNRIAYTHTGDTIHFEFLISSAPFDQFAALCNLDLDTRHLSRNQVLVFNLGFDSKGPEHIHWTYFPDPDIRFYRVGFYDNITQTDRMSLYVEIGLPAHARPDPQAELQQVLRDLRKTGILTTQNLVSWHTVTMDPAYVHITRASQQAIIDARAQLTPRGVFTIGRYGAWTYCSIEDNILEAQALAAQLTPYC